MTLAQSLSIYIELTKIGKGLVFSSLTEGSKSIAILLLIDIKSSEKLSFSHKGIFDNYRCDG